LPATTSPSSCGEKALGFGDAEIRELHIAFEGDHDVLEAHVAMHDAQRTAVLVGLGVRVGQPPRHPAHDEHRQIHRQLPRLSSPVAAELGIEIHAIDQFHGDEQSPPDGLPRW
jgi:hypothetical protein